MTAGQRKDPPETTPDPLKTSEDLFGDLTDGPPKPTRRDSCEPPRAGPIRVKVAEPGRAVEPGGGALPNEVAVLLDTFDSKHGATPTQKTPGVRDQSPPAPLSPSVLLERADEPASPGLDLAAVAADALEPSPPPGDEAEPETRSRPGSAADPARPAARDAFGPYLLLERVARGGMAEVFRAKRTGIAGFEKIVAVKRILPHLSDNQEFVRMFVDEAKMVAGLTHPNIVQIFDLGKLETSYYIAMEYVHGRDLRSIQRRGEERGYRMPANLCAYLVSRVCAALDFAHRKKDDQGRPLRIVHRDVSPQNILISFDGEVKLTDFGIAKAAARASTTDKGALRGKLLFMSPEQAWGAAMDQRSDIFSLGVVFYEMLCGQKPFVGEEELGVLDMVRRCQLVPLRQVQPEIPSVLEAVVMKALEREPEQRFQTAGEMQREIDRILLERQPPGAADLAGYLGLLFDPDDRGEIGSDEVATGEDWIASGLLELDFDAPRAGRPEEEKTAPGIPRDAMSVERLLKRFRPR
jgi:serine/threonine protein kinase